MSMMPNSGYIQWGCEPGSECACYSQPNPVPFALHGVTRETWRWYFAGQAMAGMLSCQDFMNDQIAKLAMSKDECRENVARWARMQADALITELLKEPTP